MSTPSIPVLIQTALQELEVTVAQTADTIERLNTPSMSEDKGMFLVSLLRRARRSVEEVQECALRRERDQTRPTR